MLINNYSKEFLYNLKLASPVMLGMVGHIMVSFADNIMVGQLGAKELAAVSLGNSFFFIAMSLGVGFATAITPLVAEADSSKNTLAVKNSLKHGLILCVCISLVLLLGMFLSVPLMEKMNQPKDVVVLAMPYLKIIALSIVPLVIFEGLKRFSDGLSKTKYPMYAAVFSNSLNILLNYLLIFGMFGFPKLGIIGAGIGTLISRILMVFFIILIFIKKDKIRNYFLNIDIWKTEKKVFRKIFNLGFPSSLQMLFEVGIFTAAIWLSGTLGKIYQAANQIAISDFFSLRRIAISVFMLTILIEIVFAIIFLIFNEWLPTLYLETDNPEKIIENSEVILIASQLLIIVALFQIFDGLQVAILGALKGMQDVKIPTIIAFISYWIIGFPICYYLGLHTPLKSVGIWIGLLIGLCSASLLLFMRFHYLTKKLISK